MCVYGTHLCLIMVYEACRFFFKKNGLVVNVSTILTSAIYVLCIYIFLIRIFEQYWTIEKELLTTVFPGLKWPLFFFYLTTLILTNTIDV